MDGYQTPGDQNHLKGLRENCSKPIQGLPNDNITQEEGMMDKQQRDNQQDDHIESDTGAMGAFQNSIALGTRPRLPVRPRAETATTPKRKLSLI